MKHLVVALSLCLFAAATVQAAEDPIEVGIIGLDTSHVTAFTKLLNSGEVPGAKVVAAYKGGSDDIESSHTRVDNFTKELKETYGVKIVDTIESLCSMVDCILLESVDGRPHLEQVKPVFAAKKRVFIDKPVAGSLKDCLEIYRLAEEAGVPCFSSSSYRYYDGMLELLKQDVGEIKGAISWGPCHIEKTHPDLYWYGVHPTEALFTVMGPGCDYVVRTHTEDTDVVTGVWKDGRVGTLRGLRNQKTPHKVTIFGTNAVAEQQDGGDYKNLVIEIVKFFQTGVAPIQPEETINMFAFMEAADESKRRGGVPVSIAEVLEKAKQ